jgi:hypothetical protein
MASVAWFNLRSIPERKAAALTAAIGIAGVGGGSWACWPSPRDSAAR